MASTRETNQLEVLVNEYFLELFSFNPIIGSYCGLHEFDGKVPELSKAAFEARVIQLKSLLQQVENLSLNPSNIEANFDKNLLVRCIKKELFDLEDLKEYEISPLYYSFVLDVSGYIKRNYAPLGKRLESLIEHLDQLPDALAHMQANLAGELARPGLETALDAINGTIAYLQNDVTDQVISLGNSVLTDRFMLARDKAILSIMHLIGDLKGRLASAHMNFAIGAENFRKMLAVGELVDMPLDELLEVGRRDLQRNLDLIKKVSEQIAPGASVKDVMQEMIHHHPTPETLVSDTAAKLEEVRQFLIDKEVVTVPSEVRCLVAETPPFMRWGFAFMDTPGPFEKVATESFYYLTPVEAGWTDQQKEEWLTKFDYYTLQDVSIHEAYPGHFLHFLHFKQLKGKLRQLLWGANYSYAFVEGWAHYTEQMMIEQGYGAEDPRYHIAQLSEALLRSSRFIVSILMHTGDMSLEEATRFFMDNAFMEYTPAESEARRGTFDPGYLNYTLGKLLILKFLEDYKKEQGTDFSLKGFHDRLLSFGAPPLPLVRKMMLTNDDGKLL